MSNKARANGRRICSRLPSGYSTAGVKRPERESNLTLDEAEELLRRWKLRGLGGG
jgi:hypothetical protein